MKTQYKFSVKIGQMLVLGVSLMLVLALGWFSLGQARAQPFDPGPNTELMAAQTLCANTPVAVIPVGGNPRGVAIDPSRHRVYVANNGGNSVSVIDTASYAVIQTITGTVSANGIAYDATNNIIWVTNYSANQVTPIQANTDATSFTVLPSITVGTGPWGVAYEPAHNYVYVVNNGSNSVSVINAASKTLVATLGGEFGGPFHVAANPITGKAYVTNTISHTIAVLNGAAISKVIDLKPGLPSTQPYGVAVDETRNLVYVSTVDSQRIVVIGHDSFLGPDTPFGWALFYRGGGGDRTRPLPMRALAINPDIGPAYDGGHVWATTSTADGSESNQALLIPKGWAGYFHYATPNPMDSPILGEGIAIDRAADMVYVSSGTGSGSVTVWADKTDPCLRAASGADESDLITPQTFTPEGTRLFNGDITGDGAVNIFDLSFIAARYNSTNLDADINSDGKVDIFDLVMVAGKFKN